jgi:peptidoglycan/LPS O-acetylase OafA/YrhL
LITNLQVDSSGSAASLGQPQLHVTPPKSHRFLFLDALRGVAALFVVAFHFPSTMTSSLAANGLLAVDFFFCLSGFVIAFSYESRLAETISFKGFAVARLIRLYPIYAFGSFLGLLVVIFVQHLVWAALSSLTVLAFFLWPTRLSPLHQPENYPLNDPSWSLFYELLANLAYALLIKLRLAGTGVLLCIIVTSLALLIHAVLVGGTLDVGATQAGLYLGFARVSFSFFFGVLLCRLYRRRQSNAPTQRNPWLLPAGITLALIAILNSPASWMRTENFRLAAMSLCLPAMVYFGALARLPHSVIPLSYPLYLLHMPFISLMSSRRLLRLAAIHPLLSHSLVLCLIAILACAAWWIGEHVDLPIRRALTRRYNSFKQAK